MRNRGAVIFLTIALALACAYQLSFTLVTRTVERRAERFAAGFDPSLRDVKVQHFLDSIRNQPVFNLGFISFTYREVKQKEINLGLDLKGGMNVMLEISVHDIVAALSDHSRDPLFNQALNEASALEQTSSVDFITLFAQRYASLTNNAPLAFIFNTPELKDKITPQSTNEEVIKVLRAEAQSAISNSFNVIRSRIDRFGVTQPNIQMLENSGRILVELPGIKEPDRVRKLLQGTASLEFWATYDNSEINPMLVQINQITATVDQTKATAPEKGDTTAKAATGGDLQALMNRNAEKNAAAANAGDSLARQMQTTSLFSKLMPAVDNRGAAMPGPVIGRALAADRAAVDTYFELPQVKALLPRDLRLMWGVKAIDKEESIYELFAIRANTRDGRAPLDGGAVTDARAEYSQQGGASAEVSMAMNSAGAKTWARLTADNVGQSIAIVLDGFVYSAPRVNQEITGGHSQITGNFTIQEATDLANVLKSGKLPAPARIIQESVVGPSLGQESINAGMWSFVLAFAMVLLYMFFFYNTAGLVANIALLTNLFFLFGVLASFGAVLTLPGIAGIVLTMGFAVDANVLIYERVKEEVKAGKALGAALADGYKHAMSAIIDGHATIFITGVVLFFFGTGPVKGFATTLVAGIITSLFTAILVTRLIFIAMLNKGRKIRFSHKITENFLANTKVDFIHIRRYTYIISAVLFVMGIVSLSTRGLKRGVDFSGGRTFTIRFDQRVTANDVRNRIMETFPPDAGDFEVKAYGQEGNQMRIVTQYMVADTRAGVTERIDSLLFKSLLPLYKDQTLTFTDFSTNTSPNGIISAYKVGPSVASDITRNAIIAVLIAVIVIGFYITIRFRKWQWAMGAVGSIVHDVFITIGVLSLLHGELPFALELDQAFIAAILTIIGYSVNDTVIIFDRIREYRRVHPKRSLKENINQAVNSTLARTVNTCGTTVVVLLAIFIFGGEVIRGFVFTLLFGVLIGTFSSVFVATPISFDILTHKLRHKDRHMLGKDA